MKDDGRKLRSGLNFREAGTSNGGDGTRALGARASASDAAEPDSEPGSQPELESGPEFDSEPDPDPDPDSANVFKFFMKGL